MACRDARPTSTGRGGTGGRSHTAQCVRTHFRDTSAAVAAASTSHHTKRGIARESGFCLQYKLNAKLGSHRKEVPVQVQAAKGLSLPLSHWVPRNLPPTALHLWPFGGAPTEVVTLAARLENSYLCRGDAIKLRCACHGHSSARHRIQGVEVRLVECLRWRTSCHEQQDLKSLVTRPINNFEVEGCDSRNKSFQQLGQRESRSVDKALEESLVSAHNSLTFAVPEFARDTYQGPFIQCWHVVEIRLLLRGSHPGEGGPSQALKVCIGSSPSDGPRTGVAEVAVMPPPASPTSVVVRQDAREWGSVVSGGDGDPSLANACGTTDLKYARTVERPPATGPTGAVSSLPPPLSPLRTASV